MTHGDLYRQMSEDSLYYKSSNTASHGTPIECKLTPLEGNYLSGTDAISAHVAPLLKVFFFLCNILEKGYLEWNKREIK